MRSIEPVTNVDHAENMNSGSGMEQPTTRTSPLSLLMVVLKVRIDDERRTKKAPIRLKKPDIPQTTASSRYADTWRATMQPSLAGGNKRRRAVPFTARSRSQRRVELDVLHGQSEQWAIISCSAKLGLVHVMFAP